MYTPGLSIVKFAADERISEIAEEAVAYCSYWHNPRMNEKFFTWAKANDDGRMWTFALLDSLWNEYQTGNAINQLDRQPEITQADVVEMAEGMSDEALAATIAEARKLRNQSRY
jgi:hypothetical protein